MDEKFYSVNCSLTTKINILKFHCQNVFNNICTTFKDFPMMWFSMGSKLTRIRTLINCMRLPTLTIKDWLNLFVLQIILQLNLGQKLHYGEWWYRDSFNVNLR